MFKIGEFSRMTHLSIDTLRHYDRLGILVPAQVDAQSGYRLYEARQLLAAQQILALKDAGLTLPEIAALQRRQLDAEALVGLLEHKAGEMAQAVESAQDRLDRLRTHIFLMKNGGVPQMKKVTIKSTQPILVCTQRRVIPKAQFNTELEAMWPAVNEHIRRQGQKAVVPCLMLYHGGSWTFAGDTLDIEVAEPLAGPIPEGTDIRVYALPAVAEMACVVHEGSFQTLRPAFDALTEWIAQNGYEMCGPLREIYHKGDWATDNPDEYITELQVPVRKA